MQITLQKYARHEMRGSEMLDDLRLIADRVLAEGDYTSAYGWNRDGGWETFSEPGDPFLELYGTEYIAVAMFAHDDLLRAFVFTKTEVQG